MNDLKKPESYITINVNTINLKLAEIQSQKCIT